jgi:hypothetical protein
MAWRSSMKFESGGFESRALSQKILGVWLGNEMPQPMKGVTGGGVPADIFRNIVRDATKLSPPSPLRCEPSKRPSTESLRVASQEQRLENGR